VAQEEIRAQRPRQFQREDPEAGEPHARGVVQIADVEELARPGIEARQAGAPGGGLFPAGAQVRLLLQRVESGGDGPA
jgi:hypothetical protein